MILDETSSTCLHWSTFELNLRSLLDGAAKSLSRSPARILDETLSIWLFGAFLSSTWSPPPLAGAAQALSYSPARILDKTFSMCLLWTTFELNLGSPPCWGCKNLVLQPSKDSPQNLVHMAALDHFRAEPGVPPLLRLQNLCPTAQRGFSTKPCPYGYFGPLSS